MKKFIIPVLTVALLAATGCKKDFFDINKNPNAPTEESVTPAAIMPRALHTLGLRQQTTFDYAAFWMGYWGRSGSYGQSVEIESYNITSGFQTGQWTGWFDFLFDAVTMERKAKLLKQPYFEGVAKTLKAIGYMYLVDQYNNVPYGDAFDFTNKITPAYEKGEVIYADLFVQLEAASKLFAQAETEGILQFVKDADITFQGNPTSWRQLINTMRLKLLIRQSQLNNTAARNAVLAQITADGKGFLTTTAEVQPGYTASNGQRNPFYDTYKINALAVTDQYNRAANYALSKFAGADGILGANTASGAADDDIRYQFVFSRAATPTVTVNGISVTIPYKGVNFGENVPNSDPYRQQHQSQVSGPGLAKSPTQAQPIFTAMESYFLQAEAVQRGWITGNAQTLAASGTTASFTYLGAVYNATQTPAAAATAYLTTINGSGGAFPTTGTDEDKIKYIISQKYLALMGINNFEAYADYRRTGYPTDVPLSLNGSRGSNVIPLRLQYPQAEFNNNAANVAKEGTVNTQTSAVFWDK